MFCHKCGQEVPDKALFCSSCGAKQDANTLEQPNSGTQKIEEQIPLLDNFLNSANAKELYDKAYDYHEAGELAKLEQLCRVLLNNFPNSKEAKWALRNFPITRNTTTKQTSLDRSNTDTIVRLILGISGGLLLFIGLFTPVVANDTIVHNWPVTFIIFIVLAVLSIIPALSKSFDGLWLTGFASLIVSLEFFFKYRELIEWGWVLLFLGTCLLLAAAGIKNVMRLLRANAD